MTPVVRALVFANIGVFLLQQVAADGLFTHFALWPLGEHFVAYLGRVGFEPWTFVRLLSCYALILGLLLFVLAIRFLRGFRA